MPRIRWSTPWVAASGTTCLVALAAFAGLGLSAGLDGVTIFWPAAGVAAAMVTSSSPALRRYILTGVFLGTVLSAFPFEGEAWLFVIGAAVANTVEALIVGAILRTRLPATHRIVRVADIHALVTACLAGPVVGGLIGGTVTAISFGSPLRGAMLSWFAADSLGIALIGPGALAVISAFRDRLPGFKWLHILYYGIGTMGVLALATLLRELTARGFAYLIIVPLMLATVYLGQRGTVLLTAVVSFGAVIATEQGVGPFNNAVSDFHPVLAAQIFLVVIQIVLLFVSIEATRRRDVLAEIEGVFDAALDGVLLVDEGDVIRRANRSSEEMLGIRLLGKRFTDFLVEPIDAEIMVAHRAVLTRARRASKEEFWAEVSEGKVAGSSNRVRRAIVLRDVTLRIEAQEKLEKMRDQFISNMTHELRTPLTSIIGYTEWLLEGTEGETRADLELIRESAASLSGIVDDILDFKRSAESGGVSEPVNFTLLVGRVTQALEPTAQSRKVKIVADVEHNVNVVGDDRQLERVVANLVSNGIKYSNPGDIVTIELRTDGNDMCLLVADTGIGISTEDQARIFERFFRASSAVSAGIPGTGLGLSFARDIARTHKGELTLESNLGVGTTTRLRLPLRKAALQTATR